VRGDVFGMHRIFVKIGSSRVFAAGRPSKVYPFDAAAFEHPFFVLKSPVGLSLGCSTRCRPTHQHAAAPESHTKKTTRPEIKPQQNVLEVQVVAGGE
jgi:hypothetical protein